MASADACANCFCFHKRELSERQRELAQARGMDVSLGSCRRYPEPIPKREEDWCYEHKRRK